MFSLYKELKKDIFIQFLQFFFYMVITNKLIILNENRHILC